MENSREGRIKKLEMGKDSKHGQMCRRFQKSCIMDKVQLKDRSSKYYKVRRMPKIR